MSKTANAVQAGARAPQKDESPATAATAQGSKVQSQIERVQCATEGAAAQTESGKEFANLRAAYALKGWELLREEGGDLLAGRWGLYRPLKGLPDAVRFLMQIGGAHG